MSTSGNLQMTWSGVLFSGHMTFLIFCEKKAVLIPQWIHLSRESICFLDEPVNSKIGYSSRLDKKILSTSCVVEGRPFLIWCKVQIEVAMFLSVVLICGWSGISQSVLNPRVFIDFLAWIVCSPTFIDLFKSPMLAWLLNITNSVFIAFSCNFFFSKIEHRCSICVSMVLLAVEIFLSAAKETVCPQSNEKFQFCIMVIGHIISIQ